MCKNKGRAFNYCSQKMVLLSHCTNCRSEDFLSLGTIYKRGSHRRSNITVQTSSYEQVVWEQTGTDSLLQASCTLSPGMWLTLSEMNGGGDGEHLEVHEQTEAVTHELFKHKPMKIWNEQLLSALPLWALCGEKERKIITYLLSCKNKPTTHTHKRRHTSCVCLPVLVAAQAWVSYLKE